MPWVWWADDPLDGIAEDALDRQLFVKRVGEMLVAIGDSVTSTVIGVSGPWGSGKTSTVNMIIAGLDKERWGVAHVTPWALTGADAVISEFLAAIGSALPQDEKASKGAREALLRYGQLAVPLLSLIPVAGDSAKGLAEAALGKLTDEGTVHERVAKLAVELRKLGRPLLIVIDDVDRLQPGELLAVFKAVRVLGRLPNVHYILIYDQQTILDVLTATPLASGKEERALAFLEKVITLPLDQPPTRSQQTASMFKEGLDVVLAAAGISALSSEQRERLDVERELLLSGTLTEPRAVRRFLTQLHAYLPLVGISEVDVVDLVVLTLLRTEYPRLYRSISASRRLLVGEPNERDASLRTDWINEENLTDLEVPREDLARVSGGLRRLFPLLDEQDASLQLRSSLKRRKDRRASDPDHVDRYFALTQMSDDLPNRELIAALQLWASGRAKEVDSKISTLLTPREDDPAACELAARAMRRAITASEDLASPAAGRLLAVVLGFIPEPTAVARPGAVDDALIAWMAELLTKVDQVEPRDILAPLSGSASSPSALGYLIRAIKLVHRVPTAHHTKDADASAGWYTSFVDATAEAVWERFTASVHMGDDAPIEAAELFGRWLEETWGRPELNRRLAGCIVDGMDPLHLAARFVDTGVDLRVGRPTLIGFDATDFLRRAGEMRVPAAQLQSAVAGTQSLAVDEDDTSWHSRRISAAQALRPILQSEADISWDMPKVAFDAPPVTLQARKLDLLDANGDQPDLRMQLTSVVSPALGGTLAGSKDSPKREPEQIAIDVLANSPISRWLSSIAPAWHSEAEEWQLINGDRRTFAQARQTLVRVGSNGVTPRQTWPIRLGAHLETVEASPSRGWNGGELILTVDMGVWLAELDEARRPVIAMGRDHPFPAALTLTELFQAVQSLVACGRSATKAFELVWPGRRNDEQVLIDLQLEVPSGLAAPVNLAGLSRLLASAVRGQHRLTFSIEEHQLTSGLFSVSPADEDAAAAVLAEWLRDSGYRGFEGDLREIWHQAV